MVRRALIGIAAALVPGVAALGEEIVASKNFIAFVSEPTTAEITAARRAARALFAKAEGAGFPIVARVARTNSTTLISLESVAISERAKGCPLLVFRDITADPVLKTNAFQNAVLDYRDGATYLLLRVWDKVSECRISDVAKARCHPVKPPAR